MFPATEAYLSQLDALKILVSLKQIFHHSKRSFYDLAAISLACFCEVSSSQPRFSVGVVLFMVYFVFDQCS